VPTYAIIVWMKFVGFDEFGVSTQAGYASMMMMMMMMR